ncbi:MAG TPA: BamA/TamA family outer membrane protein [Chitinophagaceae bacterium]|nr:BamA/TamA family outer membrane protein [Chitinophagaceae bacterium]
MNTVIKAAFFISIVLFASCSNTRHLPPGDALYTGASVKITDKDIATKNKKTLQNDLAAITRPKPNTKFLGMRLKLAFFNLAGNPNKKGFIRKFLRKFGEPPVLLSDVNLENNSKVLKNNLENKGYFHAAVSGDTTVKNKKAHATYTVHTGPVYTIKEIVFPKDTVTQLDVALKNTEPKSLLKAGIPFNLDLIKAERLRIDAALKEKGYYFFSPDYLLINADSTIGNNMVNLYMTVKTNTPFAARKAYTINEIYIYSNYTLSTAAIDTSHDFEEFYKGYYVIDKNKMFKPSLFEHVMQFKPNDLYNRTAHNLALNRLVNLGVYKFVKNRFEVDPYTDELNTFYYLTPLPRKTLRAEISGNTKSNNNAGSVFSVSWRHKNFLRGAELFAANVYVGSEVQFSGRQKGFNTNKLGGEVSLTVPKFIIPFFVFNTKGAYVPKSYARIGYDLLNRTLLYTLNSFRADLGYTWKPDRRNEYRYNPISVNYVQPFHITQRYKDSINGINGRKGDFTLKKAIEKQFIIGSNATYSYDELIDNPAGKGWFVLTNLDLSGNLIGLFTKPDLKNGDTIKFFGAPYAEYMKAEVDVRHYSRIAPKTIWANRIDLGVGLPHGNSGELPFIKQFFIGGTNSLRGFRSRTLGPGTYRPLNADSTDFYPDQSGDIKLEINTELRQKISGILEGAIFAEAGNIWLRNKNPDKPGGEFTGKFLSQLAADVGVGIRFNMTILVLRFDVAVPISKPWTLPPPSTLQEINFRNQAWRKENIVFNLAIGYPF